VQACWAGDLYHDSIATDHVTTAAEAICTLKRVSRGRRFWQPVYIGHVKWLCDNNQISMVSGWRQPRKNYNKKSHTRLLPHVFFIETCTYYIIHLSGGIARNFSARGKQCCSEYFWCPEPIWILLALHWRPLAALTTSLINLDPPLFSTYRCLCLNHGPPATLYTGPTSSCHRAGTAGVCHHGPYDVPSYE